MPEQNGWSEWSKYVLKELERLNDGYEKLQVEVSKITTKLTVLEGKLSNGPQKKVEVKPWSVISGSLPPSLMLFLWFVGKAKGWW